jgi:hypothetical protein
MGCGDVKFHGPNAIACTVVSGRYRRRLIGAYFPPSELDGTSLSRMEAAAREVKDKIILLRDFNVSMRSVADNRHALLYGEGEAQEGGQAAVSAAITGLGLVNLSKTVSPARQDRNLDTDCDAK